MAQSKLIQSGMAWTGVFLNLFLGVLTVFVLPLLLIGILIWDAIQPSKKSRRWFRNTLLSAGILLPIILAVVYWQGCLIITPYTQAFAVVLFLASLSNLWLAKSQRLVS